MLKLRKIKNSPLQGEPALLVRSISCILALFILMTLLYINTPKIEVVEADYKLENEAPFLHTLMSSIREASETQEQEQEELGPEWMSHRDMFFTSEDRHIRKPEKKTVYLTFDDGPSENTGRILDILDEYNAKATFFVIEDRTGQYTHMYKEIVDRGHAIGLHSASHDYDQIYSSKEAFIEDCYRIFTIIRENTGVETNLYRFPGGSVSGNTGRQQVIDEVRDEMKERGFLLYDWNASAEDAYKKKPLPEKIAENMSLYLDKYDESCILIHDRKDLDVSVEGLRLFFEMHKEDGLLYAPITSETREFPFRER